MRARWLFVLLLAGCELAPSEPQLTSLASVQGIVTGDLQGRRADVLISWYLFSVTAETETSWQTTDRVAVRGGRFSLPLFAFPPEEAFFVVDDQVRLAAGFLSLVDASAAPAFVELPPSSRTGQPVNLDLRKARGDRIPNPL